MSKRKFWRRRVHDLLSSLDAPRPCDHIVCGGGATSPPFNSLSPSFQIHSSILGEYNTTMTITTDNADLETGGLSGFSCPSPSAPPASTLVPNNEHSEPIAIPIAMAIPIAQSGPTSSSSNPSIVMERNTNSDGSLSVKVTKTTSPPNGYRNVMIEHYHIPSSMVNTVRTSLDATGEPPSSLYLTRTEETSMLPPLSLPHVYPTPCEVQLASRPDGVGVGCFGCGFFLVITLIIMIYARTR